MLSASTAHGRDRAASSECFVLVRPAAASPLNARALWTESTAARALVLLLAAFLVLPASAASVAFDNCLPNAYKYNDPTPLQWVPVHVDAIFDTDDPSHTLQVIVFGNVTGSRRNVTLPPPSSPQWADANFTDGKILDLADPETGEDALLTTLRKKVEVLSYKPYNAITEFCEELDKGACPLAPVFNTSGIPVTDLPSIRLTNRFYSSYAFASFSTTFIVSYGNDPSTNIACVSATVTPDLGSLVWALKFLPLMVLLSVGFATIFSAIFSPWGSSDVFHWTSNYGRDADLLRLVTPGFGDCLQYIQFIALTGGLTINYPGFYQPIVSQVSWSSLMFNQSFVRTSPGHEALMDGIYVTNGEYGLQDLSQLVGMAYAEDVWAGMMIWLLVIIGSAFVLIQAGFLLQWLYRNLKRVPEEDLRAKNIPFSLGNVIRLVLNYFLLPIVALSTFQLVVASHSPGFTVGLAVVTLLLIVGFAAWLLYLIVKTRPRAHLFDDLPTVLLYGPLYNTFSDEAAAFALIPVLLTFIRGIAIGAVQPAGIAQLVLLAICEVIHILTLHAFRPFHSPTSMNAYHTLFSALRLISVLLMVAFIPSLGVTEGPKGWIGYAILLIHAGVLILGFFLNALQTMVEVIARMLGAGGDDARGLTRGGLSKIFGARQLSRRMSRRENRGGPSRQSQLSSAAMLDADEVTKAGYVMPGGRVRSESAGSIGAFLNNNQRSSSVLDSYSVDASSVLPGVRNHDGAGSFTPTTPGEASPFSYLPSGTPNRGARAAMAMEASDPYYRPPRRRRGTLETPLDASDQRPDSWTSADWPQNRFSQAAGPSGDATGDFEGPISRGATPAPYAHPNISLAPRTDYSTREVDFYYGVRGPALNSEGPGRRLGTGPADPTGPMASAAGWFRSLLGGKSKEKGKGFEVVRSARMPAAMRARGGAFGDETPPEGIPVAMGVLRNGPIESDDEGDNARSKTKTAPSMAAASRAGNKERQSAEGELLNLEDGAADGYRDEVEPPMLPDIEAGDSIHLPSRIQSNASRRLPVNTKEAVQIPEAVPDIPRKSSRRLSDGTLGGHMRNLSTNTVTGPSNHGIDHGKDDGTASLKPAVTRTSSRLPFERSGSQRRLSSGSSMGNTDELSQVDMQGHSGYEDRPTSFGYVAQGSINRVDPNSQEQVDLLGSSAEVVDERR